MFRAVMLAFLCCVLFLSPVINSLHAAEVDPVMDNINQLKDKDKEVRIKAIQGMSGKGLWDNRSLEPLILLVKNDPELDVRVNAALALGYFANPLAVDVLLPLLADKEFDLKQAAIDSLGMIGDGRAAAELLRLAQADNGAMGSSAVQALARIGDQRSMEALFTLAQDAKSPWKIDAGIALSYTGDKRPVDITLERIKADMKSATPRDLMLLASALDPQSLPVLLSLLKARLLLEPTLYTIAGLRDSRAINEIVSLMNDVTVSLESRATAAYALGEIHDTAATRPLLAALAASIKITDKTAAAKFRQSILIALASIDDPQAADALLAMGQNENIEEHQLALSIFKMLGNVKAIPMLEESARDENSELQWDSLLALAGIADKKAVKIVVETLISRKLNEKNWEYGELVFAELEKNSAMTFDDWNALLLKNGGLSRAVIGMGKINDPRVLDAIVGWIADRDGTGDGLQRNYDRATPILKNMGKKAVDALIVELQKPLGTNKAYLIAILGGLADERAIPVITLYLDDEVLRTSAMIALMKLHAPNIVDLLLSEADKKDGKYRNVACWALGLADDKRANELLLRLLKEEDPKAQATEGSGVRNAAADSLGMLADKRAIDGLIELLSVRNTDMRISASIALGKFALDNRALMPLINYLLNEHDAQNVYYGYTAIPALLRINDRRILPFLLALIQPEIGDADYQLMQRNLISGMVNSADTRVMPRLLMMISPFRDKSAGFDVEIVQALGARKDKAAVPALLRMIKDNNPTIRLEAQKSLQQISGESIGDDQAAWINWWLKNRNN